MGRKVITEDLNQKSLAGLVLSKTLLGQLFITSAGFAVVGIRIDADATARSEQSGNLYIFRIHQFDKIFHDDVHTILMEISMITETEEVELQALALHHPLSWNVE